MKTNIHWIISLIRRDNGKVGNNCVINLKYATVQYQMDKYYNTVIFPQFKSFSDLDTFYDFK